MVQIKGSDYANAGMTDATTALGMRLAMFDAVRAWKTLPEGQRTQEKAIELIGTHARSHDLLKAAGTQEIVARFYQDIASKGNAVGFLNAVNPGEIKDIEKFLKTGDVSGVLSAASSFSKAAATHLGMGTLTETFINNLKTKPELSNGVTIQPTALDRDQAKAVAKYDAKFRDLDAIDDAIYQTIKTGKNSHGPIAKTLGYALEALGNLVGVGMPAVQQHIAPPPNAALGVLEMDKTLGARFEHPVPPAIKQIMDTGFQAVGQQGAIDQAIKIANIKPLENTGNQAAYVPPRPASEIIRT